MDNSTFKKLLVDRKVAVVHFSHHAVMGHSVVFPDDLRHAISSYMCETRSCCALFPDHHMDLPGSVGVIFEPDFDQVLSVLGNDSGSSDHGGYELSGGDAPSEQSIVNSLSVPLGQYNEWRLLGAKPIGIFVANPENVMVKKFCRLAEPGCEPFDGIGCTTVPFSEVVDAFSSYSIFTMKSSGLVKI